jgi:nifR3 family TIM-barrel protein
MGAKMAFTEMISAKGLLLGNQRTYEFLKIHENEHWAGAQLFGSDPEEMAAAAQIIEKEGFSVVDLNMGCPVRKVVSHGAGAALLKTPQLAATIASAVVKRVRIPVMCKIRAGWSSDCINAVSVAQELEGAGISAITVHPRTRDQGYAGKSDWKLIAEVKRNLRIPVVGNGDVVDGESALRLYNQTFCDGIMIGRAALGHPWVFREVAAALEGRPFKNKVSPNDRYAIFMEHYKGLQSECGENRAFHKMKRFSSWYTRGYQGASTARAALHRCTSDEAMIEIVRNLFMGLTQPN